MGESHGLKRQGVTECAGPASDAGSGDASAEDGYGAGSGAAVHTPRAARAPQYGGRAQNVGSHPKQTRGGQQSPQGGAIELHQATHV